MTTELHELAEALCELHNRNFEPTELRTFQKLIGEYWLDTTPDLEVALRLFLATLQRQSQEVLLPGDNSNLSSMLQDLAERHHWLVDDSGEDCVVKFPRDRSEIVIFRESPEIYAVIRVMKF